MPQSTSDHPEIPNCPGLYDIRRLSFDPTPETTAEVFASLSQPSACLESIAQSFQVSLEALTLWMARPDIAARIDALESAAARRTRFVATSELHTAVSALAASLSGHTYDEGHIPYSSNFDSIQLRLRQRCEARRSAALLARISNFHNHPPTPPRKPAEPEHCAPKDRPAELPTVVDVIDLNALLTHARAHLTQHAATPSPEVAPADQLPATAPPARASTATNSFAPAAAPAALNPAASTTPTTALPAQPINRSATAPAPVDSTNSQAPTDKCGEPFTSTAHARPHNPDSNSVPSVSSVVTLDAAPPPQPSNTTSTQLTTAGTPP